MLFTCTPRSCAARRPASRKTVSAGNKTLSVDLHCHIHTPPVDALAEKTGKLSDPILRYGYQRTMERQRKLRAQLDRKLTSIEQRLSDMDRMGIDVQAISTSPLQYYYGVDADAGREIARTINDRLAEMVAAHPDRFVALGTLPMQEPELALQELVHCVKDRG
jgi:aminocarboxymuconate-semialdehyde decarboxylase